MESPYYNPDGTIAMVDYRDGLRKEASARERLHQYHESSRPLSPKYEYVGLMGEYLFADTYKQPRDRTLRPQGDGGWDFFFPGFGGVDVKTARKPWNLLVEEGHLLLERTIYVQCGYSDATDSAYFVGWAYGWDFDPPVRRFGDSPIWNHWLPRKWLQPMAHLPKALKIE